MSSSSGPSSLSSELLLLQAANTLGYSPKVVDGEVIFCQHEELTESMIPKMDCISAEALRAEARGKGN